MGITTLQFLFKGIIAGLWVSVPLGPIGVLLIQRTMNKGVKSGFISGLGVATADTFYAMIAVFGITFLSNFFESQQTILTILGIIILLVMGIKMYNSDPVSCLKKKKENSGNEFTDFFSMFMLTITNPLTIIIFSTVFALLGIGLIQTNKFGAIVVTFGIYIGASLWWFLLSSGVNFFRHKIKLKSLFWMNRITGVIIILIALGGAVSSLLLLFK